VFTLSGKGKALALVLAEQGWDVWLGNARTNMHSKQHTKYSRYDTRYWDWSTDDLSKDVAASYQHILEHTPRCSSSDKIVYVGHSQGAAMWLQAAARNPWVDEHTRIAILCAPAAYVQELSSPWLRGLTWLHLNYPNIFLTLMGKLAFMPVMENAKEWVSASFFSHLGALMFTHLFNWRCTLWDNDVKAAYFCEQIDLSCLQLTPFELTTC
jgi:lysosomal acid lipase/cholesteryl ester hydrolase